MHSNSIKAYKTLFEAIERPLLYTAPWWLDATCGEGGWDAVIHFEGKKPIAGLAYHNNSIRGLSAIITPPLTQWVSVLSTGEISNTVLDKLLSGLPKVSIFDLTLKPIKDIHIQSDRFPVDLKYSYVHPSLEDMDTIRSGYNAGLKRNIRMAEDNYTFEASEDVSVFLDLCDSSYQRQQMKTPPWLGVVIPKVFKGFKTNKCGKLILASLEGQIIAGILTGWDEHTTYYLAGGRAAGDQAVSAHSLLLDHAINMAYQRNTSFDFEGSMHPGIASFYQSFGATPIPYWHIKKYRGLGKLWSALK